jgi:hypothetical protein
LSTDYLKNVFRWLHVAWAIIGAGVCILLAFARGGHPPGIVFIPVAAVIWLAGHMLLWASRKLAVRGKNRADNRSDVSGKWPAMIILLVFICGVVFIVGLFGIVWQVISERDWLREIAIPLLIWIPSSLCFFGILLRQDWSRLLAGSGLIVLAVILLYEMIMSLMRGYQNSITEWVIVIAVFGLLIFFGQYILRSSSIKTFYSKS